MEAPYQAALEQAPVAVDGPRVNLAADVFLRGVVYYFVPLDIGWHPVILARLVGANQVRLNGDPFL